ncbi:hypothetical protein SAMN05421736_12528 [Evansella caseinilytica]|uniref:Uncharacterized protein n=1 Tax=Evansella caseinilytica TaxID=1503961 RepID=A0A1H3URX7_9BACI|nr:hypothetical protein SAMN05421736_12528 [Evansella caseinilytica]
MIEATVNRTAFKKGVKDKGLVVTLSFFSEYV